MDRKTTLYWIWLAEACGPESALPVQLWSRVRDIEAIYTMTHDDYAALKGIRESQITALCDKDLYRAKRIEEACARHNIGILPLNAPLYPDRLRKIHCPPAVLYYRGYLPDFNGRLSIAIVGTRGMTDEGRRSGYRVSYELSVAGAIIVSGMALGVDGIAQKAALDAEGCSIAVLGTAIDRCYPQEHQPLYDRLLLNGGIISEYAPGCDTHPWHFPQRNRIISGLCQGTLVVEAGQKSGALITAETAHLQGRTVFAMPGPPSDPAHVGTNNLLKAGAVPVTCATDILTHYAPLYDATIFPENIGIPLLFENYDDTLKYGAERIARRRDEQGYRIPPPVFPARRRKTQETEPALSESVPEQASAQTQTQASAPTSAPEENGQTRPAGQAHPIVQDNPAGQSRPLLSRQAPADMTAREEPFSESDTRGMTEESPAYEAPAQNASVPEPSSASSSDITALDAVINDDVISPTASPKAAAEAKRLITAALARKTGRQTSGTSSVTEEKTPASIIPAPTPAPAHAESPAPADPSAAHGQTADAAPQTPMQSDTKQIPAHLTDIQKHILAMIGDGKSFDEMCAAGIRASELMVELTILELDGHITSVPGGGYKRT